MKDRGAKTALGVKQGLRYLLVCLMSSFLLTGCFADMEWKWAYDDGVKALKYNDLSKAQEKFTKAVLISEKFGPADPRFINSMRYLADTYITQDQFAEAEPFYLKVLQYEQSKGGKDSLPLAMTYYRLGQIYVQTKEISSAKEALDQAQVILHNLGADDSLDWARVMACKGSLYLQSNRISQAQKYCEKALAIYEQDPSTPTTDKGKVLSDLGNVYRAQDESDKVAEVKQKLTMLSLEKARNVIQTMSPLTSAGHVKTGNNDEP